MNWMLWALNILLALAFVYGVLIVDLPVIISAGFALTWGLLLASSF